MSYNSACLDVNWVKVNYGCEVVCILIAPKTPQLEGTAKTEKSVQFQFWKSETQRHGTSWYESFPSLIRDIPLPGNIAINV